MNSPTQSPAADHKKESSSLLTKIKAFLGLGEASVRQDLQEVLDEAKTDEDRKSTRLNSSHVKRSRMPSSA